MNPDFENFCFLNEALNGRTSLGFSIIAADARSGNQKMFSRRIQCRCWEAVWFEPQMDTDFEPRTTPKTRTRIDAANFSAQTRR